MPVSDWNQINLDKLLHESLHSGHQTGGLFERVGDFRMHREAAPCHFHVVQVSCRLRHSYRSSVLRGRSCITAYQFIPGQGMAEMKTTVKLIMAVTGKNAAPGAVIYGGPQDLSVISTGFNKTPCLKLIAKELPPEGSE